MHVGSILLTPVHHDTRRMIFEHNDIINNYSIQGFQIYSRSTLGIHAHAKKTECFHILSGGGKVLTQLSFDGKPVHKEDPFSIEQVVPGSVIFVPKNLAHTFYLEPGTEIICFSSVAFNPKNVDIIPCPWLKL